MGASWYALMVDLAYTYGIDEIYDWGQEVESSNLPQGRKHVTTMLQKMEGGTRLQTTAATPSDLSGALATVKNEKIYLLLYNHNLEREATADRLVFPKVEGSLLKNVDRLKMTEWTVDRNNGIFMHRLYEDIRASGVAEKNDGRIYGNRPSDRFENEWKNILNSNLSRYEELAQLPKTIVDSAVYKQNNTLTLKVKMAPHSVKLIELIPE